MLKKLSEYLIEQAERNLPAEVVERLSQIPVRETTDAGYDEFGFNPEFLKIVAGPGLRMYRDWFRTETCGIANIPLEGPALLIANHSGQLPIDGMMISVACLMEMDKPRLPRAMIEKWIPSLPLFSIIFSRVGQVAGLMENAEKLLAAGEIVLIFPEGARGSGKTWDKRYQLQKFTVGFMELAIKFSAPIVPIAVIGGEEQAPAFHDSKTLAKLLGFPYFPITPTFPWLGPIGLFPLPSKYHLIFGEKLDFSQYTEDLEHPDHLKAYVETVTNTIQQMMNKGLEERIFPGF